MKKFALYFTLFSSSLAVANSTPIETISSSSINLQSAARVSQLAIKKASEMKLEVCIAIVDSTGNLIHFQRMDGTKVASVTIALDKAYTAASYQKSTGALGKVSQPGTAAYGLITVPRTIVFQGGVPIKSKDGSTIGGIGISGASAAQDEEIALYALGK